MDDIIAIQQSYEALVIASLSTKGSSANRPMVEPIAEALAHDVQYYGVVDSCHSVAGGTMILLTYHYDHYCAHNGAKAAVAGHDAMLSAKQYRRMLWSPNRYHSTYGDSGNTSASSSSSSLSLLRSSSYGTIVWDHVIPPRELYNEVCVRGNDIFMVPVHPQSMHYNRAALFDAVVYRLVISSSTMTDVC